MSNAALGRQRHKGATSRARSCFTTLELMVAMVLVMFITVMLVKFFSNMQNAWRYTMNTTAVYEDSRIAFDIVTRDLQTAIARADDIPGKHIRFHQPDSESLWFMTVGETSREATCNLIEVGYRLENDELQRAFVDNSNAAWNVYGDRDEASDQDGYRRIISGVLVLKISCLDNSLTSYVPSHETSLPFAVTIEMTLLDRQSRKLAEKLPADKQAELRAKMARSFRKTIHVNSLTNLL